MAAGAPVITDVPAAVTARALARSLRAQPGLVALCSEAPDTAESRFSFVAARPFLTLTARGESIVLSQGGRCQRLTGNPWKVLGEILSRFDVSGEADHPFPLGGCFGYWGYDLGRFVEPRLARSPHRSAPFPDCQVGLYDSVVVFDRAQGRSWIVSTGLGPDGSQSRNRALARRDSWQRWIDKPPRPTPSPAPARPAASKDELRSNLDRAAFVQRVREAQRLIRMGEIYQVNLSRQLTVPTRQPAWDLYERLATASPAPFAGFYQAGSFQLVSSSPELFLELVGCEARTRPIKGTRPRAADAQRDRQLAHELRASPKENAELVMITDLLRNDLGRVCEYGSVHVPELARLESHPHVHHLVSTVRGRLPRRFPHHDVLAACFPGGSITGAPKIRAMEIIDRLESVPRGPYTGCLGYIGFNRRSQFNILIRTAICTPRRTHFHTGAGIVADSDPDTEFDETTAKAQGFLEAVGCAAAWVSGSSQPERFPV